MTEPELRVKCVEVVARMVLPKDVYGISSDRVLSEAQRVYEWCTQNRTNIPWVNIK